MKNSRAFLLFTIALAMCWLTIGCRRSLPLQEGVGERTIQPVIGLPEDADEIVQRSTELIEAFASAAGKEILGILFTRAAAVAIIPGLTDASFNAAGNRGPGLLLTRRENQWTLPVFVSVSGSSLGEQIGTISTDFLLFFRNPETVSKLEKEGDIGLGAGLSAALGPIGASADLSFIRNADVVAYKFTEGEFVGFHVPEGVLSLEPEMTLGYYVEPEQGAVRGYYGNEAERLVNELLSLDERSTSEGTPKRKAKELKLTLDRLTHAAGH